jgi:hypothetical protein
LPSLMGLFISFPSSSHASCFYILLKRIGCFRSHYYFFSFIKFDKFYDIFLSPLHFTMTKTLKKRHWTPQICTTLPERTIMNENKWKAAGSGDMSHSTSRPAHAVTLLSLWCDGQIPAAHQTCS